MQSALRELEFRIVDLDTADLRNRASSLYREVFGYRSDENALSPRLLRGLLLNGGSAVGALDPDGDLVGFSYGFPATDEGRLFHYSQATAILDRCQGQGLGRTLKEAQAVVARAAGADTMRWAFDPANARNAHFNLETLGARGRWFHRDFYDEPDTDRLIVEWPLTDEGKTPAGVWAAREQAIAEILDQKPGTLQSGTAAGYGWAVIPAAEPGRPARGAIRAACEDAIAQGSAAVACRRIPGTADALYLFAEVDR
jgi:predicted GNAT superfamily acetyltransferase